MVEEKFLIDSNSFITPYRNYYAFDLIPAYWKKLSKYIEAGRLILLDIVKTEIDKGQDDLSNWINSQQGFIICKHVDAEIVNQYSKVIHYIETCNFYSNATSTSWLRDDTVADPWLIAAAKVHGYTIITAEEPS